MKGCITAALLLITVLAQAQRPPKAEIITPVSIKAAPVKPAANEVWLNLQVRTGAEVNYWVQTAEQQPAPVRSVTCDSAAVEAVIRQYQQATAGKKLVILLRSDARTPFTDIKPVMDALKGAGIYTYKLITDPETKQ